MADESVAAVHSLGRRPLSLDHPKLTQHTVNFAALPVLPQVGEAYIALGTTIKVAGSQQAFRAVDHDAVLNVARAAIASGATKLGAISAMGANARSPVFYNRVKGETEEALASLGFATLVIARPSFLAGDRDAIGQPQRAGEKIALAATRLLRPLIPANYQDINAAKVARALLDAVRRGLPGKQVLLSGEMQGS